MLTFQGQSPSFLGIGCVRYVLCFLRFGTSYRSHKAPSLLKTISWSNNTRCNVTPPIPDSTNALYVLRLLLELTMRQGMPGTKSTSFLKNDHPSLCPTVLRSSSDTRLPPTAFVLSCPLLPKVHFFLVLSNVDQIIATRLYATVGSRINEQGNFFFLNVLRIYFLPATV